MFFILLGTCVLLITFTVIFAYVGYLELSCKLMEIFMCIVTIIVIGLGCLTTYAGIAQVFFDV